MDNLKRKTIWGVFWSAVQRFGALSISFLTNIVLARLLLPADFGAIGMLAVFIGISSVFIDGGFASALIQRENPTDRDYSTVFYWNLLLSALFYVLIFFTAPFVSAFYRIDLTTLLRVLALSLIISAFSTVQTNRMIKQMNFKLLSKITILSAIAGSAVGISTALLGHGVWAIVWKNLSQLLLQAILLWIATKWRPLLVFSKASFKRLFGFGSMLLISNLTESIVFHLQSLLIGKLYSPTELGYYTQAKHLHEIPERTIPAIIDQVAFPMFSSIQNDKQRVIRALQKSLNLVSFVNFPVMILMAITAPQLITLLYGEKWLDSVIFLQILCFGGMWYGLNSNNSNTVKSLGKSQYILYSTIIKRITTITGIIVGSFWGINGLVVGYCLSVHLWYPINAYYTKKTCGAGLLLQSRSFLFNYANTIASGLITYVLNIYLEEKLSPILSLLVVTLAFVTIYLLFAVIFKSEALRFIRDILKQQSCSRLNKNGNHETFKK